MTGPRSSKIRALSVGSAANGTRLSDPSGTTKTRRASPMCSASRSQTRRRRARPESREDRHFPTRAEEVAPPRPRYRRATPTPACRSPGRTRAEPRPAAGRAAGRTRCTTGRRVPERARFLPAVVAGDRERRAVVARNRHQGAVGGQCGRYLIGADSSSAPLGPEVGASFGQRLLGRFALLPSGVDQGRVLRRRHRPRATHQEIGEPLLRGGHRRAGRVGGGLAVATDVAPRRDLVEDERSALDQSVNGLGHRRRRHAGQREDQVQPAGAGGGVVQRLTLWQGAQHQVQVVATASFGLCGHAQSACLSPSLARVGAKPTCASA